MKILVIGGGAREHALLWKLKQSPQVSQLFVAPGNAGMESLATRIVQGDRIPDAEYYAGLAEANGIDLTIVGPEFLLVDGLVDYFHIRGLRVFGPTSGAARLEGSKIWAKEVMQRVGIPTASWQQFSETEAARSHALQLNWRCVIKADGLASGKGSFVCENQQQVESALVALLGHPRFRERPIIIEELLDGQEVSVFAISDGHTVVPFGAAQDHKRVFDKDEGPNTGGMGAYSPVNHMQVAQDFAGSFFEPIVNQFAAIGEPYVGVLYAGAIVTTQGPRILEFNCRFGDPEAEVLLCRLDEDLAQLLLDATEGRLDKWGPLNWKSQEAVCVVLAAKNYPMENDLGTPIHGVGAAQKVPGVLVFHAGTEIDPGSGELVTNGGRILSVTGTGDNLEEARTRAYTAVEKIEFEGKQYREDIATKAIGTAWSDAFGTELRKPPRWEVQKRHISRTISKAASDLELLQLEGDESREQFIAQIRLILDRLYELKISINQSVAVPKTIDDFEIESNSNSEVRTRLISLETEFNSLVERMQTPDAAATIDRLYHSTPTQLAEIVSAFRTTRKRD